MTTPRPRPVLSNPPCPHATAPRPPRIEAQTHGLAAWVARTGAAVFGGVVGLALALPICAEAKPALMPPDIFELEWASSPELSPDGRQVVYLRNHFDKLNDRRRGHLWLLDIERNTHQPLTTGRAGDGPALWSPDGKRIAWISSREGSAQVWVRWMDSGEAAQLTKLERAPQGLSWSPDGRWLAFTQLVPAKSEPLAKLPPKPEGAQWAPAAKLIEDVGYRADGRGYLEAGYSHVFVLPAEGGTPRQLSTGKVHHRGTPVWTADGKALLIAANYAEGADLDPIETELYRIELETGKAAPLTQRKGPDMHPALSPDGRRVAYLGFDDVRRGYQQTGLYVLDLERGSSQRLAQDFDHAIESPAWSGDGRHIYFSYDRHGDTHIARVPAGGGRIETLASDLGGTAMGRPYGGGSFSAAGVRIAYTRGSAYAPAEVGLIERGKLRSLTDLNADLLPHRQLGEVQELWTKSSHDGLDIQSWLVLPPDFDASKKYPLLLEIHGGPYADYGPRFAPEIQLYASAGYVVLYSNPRGSTGYGQAFADHIHHAYPGHDYEDLMSAVDAAIAKGFVDPNQLFVTGGSGGGVLSAWIIGKNNRFRAAVVAKPVINWTSFVLTADYYPLFSQYWFPSMPWEDPMHYWQRSPLSLVGQVQTPTMLITGEDDYRTPISETEQYYQALKLRGVPTAMLRIPGASHGINARPSHLLAQVLNTLGWFERHKAGNRESGIGNRESLKSARSQAAKRPAPASSADVSHAGRLFRFPIPDSRFPIPGSGGKQEQR
jgi:dipeptidyl aminopeptidase/acylaminoacyl peptidase